MLERLKLYLGIKSDSKDELLTDILATTEKQMQVMLGEDNIPEELNFVLLEVAITRFNRIGSEGMKSETVDGHRVEYVMDDFANYARVLVSYLPEKEWQAGEVRFY